MSFNSLVSSLNYPPLVAATGVVILIGESLVSSTGLPLVTLKVGNVVAFVINVAAVSVPGRVDQKLVEEMRRERNNDRSESLLPQETDGGSDYSAIYAPNRGRSMIAPAPWAFAIWAIIYLGETSFCAAQFLAKDEAFQALIPGMTVPFVAANLIQSLWCASFRPSYDKGWKKYVSALMLGGTAWSLFNVQTALLQGPQSIVSMMLFLPMILHFGWTTAATLVNINGSIAMQEGVSDTAVIALGHASSLVATAVGVALTLLDSSPAYGFTLAWALAACGSGMKPRDEDSASLAKGRSIQRGLCWTGSALCIAAAVVATGVFSG